MRSITTVGILFWVALLAPLRAAENSLQGTWVGQWTREGSTVDVTLHFLKTEKGYEGTFDSEGLRVAEIPMQKILWHRPNLSWEVVSDASTETYSGQLRGNAFSGQFKQGDAKGTFSFTRARTNLPPPSHEEIKFSNGAVMLAGTIFVPTGKGPHPGIVFLHGSGAEGRWASNYLAGAFARRGFAALTFDKRGVGKSGGDWQQAGFEELAEDAAAAVTALSARPYVDRGRVGIHGHSQGGTLSPLAAVRIGHPAFVIASAASGLSARDTETFSVGNSLGIKGMASSDAEEARKFVDAIMETAFSGQPYECVVEAWQKVQKQPWAFEPPPKTDPYWRFMQRIADYDGVSFWRQLSAPTLLVFGVEDERVPPRESAARIAEAYLHGHGTSLKVMFFPGADHTFRLHTNASSTFHWPKTAPGYPDAIIDWAEGIVSPGIPLTVSVPSH